MTTLKRSLPLYKGLGYSENPENQDIRSQEYFSRQANSGLYFDKFVDTWAINTTVKVKQAPTSAKYDSPKSKQGSTFVFLEEIIDHYNNGHYREILRKSLEQYHERNKTLHNTLFSGTLLAPEKHRMDFKSDWRFVSGLGNAHPFETGFIWHRTLGVPYLAGSSVKGMLRAWAEQWLSETERVSELLGPEIITDEKPAASGRIIVFDAIPNTPPNLKLDIINPHYGPYYEDKKKAPADYYNPVPVFFLSVVKGADFTFAFAPRPGSYKHDGSENEKISEDLHTVKDWLCGALENIGCGGKTSVGYGLFKHYQGLGQTNQETWQNATVCLSPGSGELTAFSNGKTAREHMIKNEDLKNFVEGLSKRRSKELKGSGITASVAVCRSGNNYKLLSISITGFSG